MRSFLIAVSILAMSIAAYGQNEQAPILEKNITYKDWTLRSIRNGGDVKLRDLTKGKKLVAVVYFAPWCPNWRHDAPMLERLYQKYKPNGFEIVAVGEYDPIDAMKTNLEQLKITFPAVYETESRDARLTSNHYGLRQETGDRRKWGSPWYIFLEPAQFEKNGDILVKQASVINGEMIEKEGEAFIRRKLGLPPENPSGQLSVTASEVEVCDPEKPSTALTTKSATKP